MLQANSSCNDLQKKKRRVCLISYTNMYIVPFAKAYINSIEQAGADCVLLYWDRESNNGEKDRALYPNLKHFVYNQTMLTGTGSPLYKVRSYYQVTRFFNKILKKERFEGIVILHTHAAIGCKRVLEKEYRGRFVVDIRDYTLEKYSMYRFLEKSIFAKAYGAVISSPAYKKFLPAGEYVMAHNYSAFPKAQLNSMQKKSCRELPINIGFVGTVRFYEMDKKILDRFGNDSRYNISYYGVGSDFLKEYSLEKGINNVAFSGTFPSDKILDMYERVSIINNLYGNHNYYLDFALSNKLYHAIQLHIPLVVCPETYMEEIVNEYHLGFVVDVNNPKAADILAAEYLAFDWESFIYGCERFKEVVIKDNKRFDQFRLDFLNSL